MSVQTPLDRPPTTTVITPLPTLRDPLPEPRRAQRADSDRLPPDTSAVPIAEERAEAPTRARRRAIERARRRDAAEQALQERDRLFLSALAVSAMPRR
ncbi:hypothetical protein [Brachybacterium tyrofermentans]|uniref:hypothetical protein n=1 Tax=Brachybacterium tyrofermentans TaxID=47848 RepID=UPI000A1B0FF4|nr:hypothetical protein [Brachybacterium tyrofermentans]SLM99001.1 hypothetical protein FM103_05550 [Corynebacterium xerosis]